MLPGTRLSVSTMSWVRGCRCKTPIRTHELDGQEHPQFAEDCPRSAVAQWQLHLTELSSSLQSQVRVS